MNYVDGYVLPVPKKNVQAYIRLAKKASKIFCEHGAVEYRECVGDDLATEWGIPFPKLMKLKSTETVIFAWVVYKSRAHRDRVIKKIMKDPRLASMNTKKMPFDMKRMTYGGFKTVVRA